MRNLIAFFIGIFLAMSMFGYAAISKNRLSGSAGGIPRMVRSPQPAIRHETTPSVQTTVRFIPPKLSEARKNFTTGISVHGAQAWPLPSPPAETFERSDYKSGSGNALPAFVTRNPRDGVRHPAIIWLSGGEPNSLGEFWRRGPESNEQSGSAYREAGVVMMFPVLRGGNEDRGGKEFFLGEVDDIIAAANHLAKLDYVNPERIYLGGHSTGGTLALLVAETSDRFAGVFSFGPVASVTRYPASVVPVDFSTKNIEEAALRSPLHWLHGIDTPTFVIEGVDQPSNRLEAEKICDYSKNPHLQCIFVGESDHFSVLSKVSTVIAARVAISDSRDFDLRQSDFQ